MNKSLIIGIDIRDLKIAKTGAKTYLEEILNEFKSDDHGCEIKFFDTSIPVYTGSNKFLKLIEHVRFFFLEAAGTSNKGLCSSLRLAFLYRLFCALYPFGL